MNTIRNADHRDYKRIESALRDEPRDKLNISNGGGKFRPRMYSGESIQFLSIFACFYDQYAHRY